MNIKLLQMAVNFSLAESKNGKQLYEKTIPYDEKEVTSGLKDLSVDLMDIQYQLTASQRSRLNIYDRAIHQLQEMINEITTTDGEYSEVDGNTTDNILVVINGRPFVFNFNPEMAEDLQKLIHSQIIIEHG